jgi:hypothetical protein
MSDTGWPPGWYPDPGAPATPGAVRWWDGRVWTESTAGARPSDRDATMGWVTRQRRMLGWAQAATIVYVVTTAISLSIELTRSAAFRRYVHWYHEVLTHLGTPGYVQPHAPTVLPTWFFLFAIPGIAAIVIFLMWQYRAASAGRALGWPAARSQGWGVGCWFVPIVNLWMPMQALRDCLPPGHPRRGAVWKLLAAWLITQGTGGCAAPVYAYAKSAGLVLFAVYLAADVAVLVIMLRLIRAIGAAQDQLAPVQVRP